MKKLFIILSALTLIGCGTETIIQEVPAGTGGTSGSGDVIQDFILACHEIGESHELCLSCILSRANPTLVSVCWERSEVGEACDIVENPAAKAECRRDCEPQPGPTQVEEELALCERLCRRTGLGCDVGDGI